MSTQYRVIMYERSTDREGGIIEVRPFLAAQALAIAGVADPAEPGETELSDDQARALANLLGFRANLSRYVYHLETIIATDDRLRA